MKLKAANINAANRLNVAIEISVIFKVFIIVKFLFVWLIKIKSVFGIGFIV